MIKDVKGFKKQILKLPGSVNSIGKIYVSDLFDLINNISESNADNINKPTHYHSGNIDVIKFSEENFSKEEQKGFHRINAIKYITRYDKKGSALSDLNKAKFYIDKLIEMEEQPHE